MTGLFFTFSNDRLLYLLNVNERCESELKDTELKVLSELIKNCRRSDRNLARAIGISQPTVSRTIKKLEKEGFLEYTAIPNLAKLGYEILAVIIGKRNYGVHAEIALQKAKDFIERHPNIIFVSAGTGLNSDRIAISIHKSYSDYSKFIEEVKAEWGGLLNMETFLIDLKGKDVLKHLSFKQMAKDLKEKKS
jgi:DNA-binding Lrp family transcriptional regulator